MSTYVAESSSHSIRRSGDQDGDRDFGALLRDMREQYDITQERLADAAGLSVNIIRLHESGGVVTMRAKTWECYEVGLAALGVDEADIARLNAARKRMKREQLLPPDPDNPTPVEQAKTDPLIWAVMCLYLLLYPLLIRRLAPQGDTSEDQTEGSIAHAHIPHAAPPRLHFVRWLGLQLQELYLSIRDNWILGERLRELLEFVLFVAALYTICALFVFVFSWALGWLIAIGQAIFQAMGW